MQIAYITTHPLIAKSIQSLHNLTKLEDHESNLDIFHSKEVFLIVWKDHKHLQLSLRRTIEETLYEALLIPVDTLTKINPERWIGDVITPVVMYRGERELIEGSWKQGEHDAHLSAEGTLFFEHIDPMSDFSFDGYGYSFGGSLLDLDEPIDAIHHEHIDLLYAPDGYSLGWFDILKTLQKNKDMKEALYPLFLVSDSDSATEQHTKHLIEIAAFLQSEIQSNPLSEEIALHL